MFPVRDDLAFRKARKEDFVKAREVLNVKVISDSAAFVGVSLTELNAATPPEPRCKRYWELHGETVKEAGSGTPYSRWRDDGRADPGRETGLYDD